MVFSVHAGAASDDDEEDTELGAELLLGAIELELLERDELLAEVTVELADEVVTAPHRLPVRAGTSAAAAPLVP